MEISGLDMGEAESFLLNLVTEIRASSEVHIDLSEEMRNIHDPHFPCYTFQPNGNMTLTVSWKRSKVKEKSAIDEKSFSQIAKEIEEEMGYSNLAGTMYEEFAFRVAERYIEEVEG